MFFFAIVGRIDAGEARSVGEFHQRLSDDRIARSGQLEGVEFVVEHDTEIGFQQFGCAAGFDDTGFESKWYRVGAAGDFPRSETVEVFGFEFEFIANGN